MWTSEITEVIKEQGMTKVRIKLANSVTNEIIKREIIVGTRGFTLESIKESVRRMIDDLEDIYSLDVPLGILDLTKKPDKEPTKQQNDEKEFEEKLSILKRKKSYLDLGLIDKTNLDLEIADLKLLGKNLKLL